MMFLSQVVFLLSTMLPSAGPSIGVTCIYPLDTGEYVCRRVKSVEACHRLGGITSRCPEKYK